MDNKFEFYKQAEAALLEELAAVRKLMGIYQQPESQPEPAKNSTSTPPLKRTKFPTKKGSTRAVAHAEGVGKKPSDTWDYYVLRVLRELGGTAKVGEVIDYAMKANPRIGEKLIYSAMRSRLSQAFRDGKLTATKGKTRKDGYVYHLKPETTLFNSNAA